MAFVRWKGPYAYIVHNERVEGPDGSSRVRQRVLYYLGREATVDDDVVAAVRERFPALEIDWDALKGEAAPGLNGAAAEAPPPADRDEWRDW